MILPETLLLDLRYGARMLSRNAGSTIVTVLALAIGISVNTSVFTAYKAMVARPLDAANPAEMVNIALTRESGAANFNFSYPDYLAYRDSVRSFSGMIAFRPARVTLSNAGGMISQRAGMAESGMGRLGLLPSGSTNAEFAFVYVVSENYLAVLGIQALHGRTFESESRNTPAVLISENYWTRRFARDPAILGKTVFLNGHAVTIIGITPHDFVGTGIGAPAFLLPASLDPLIQGNEQALGGRENQNYRLFGRLAAGVTISQAQAELQPIVDHLRTLHDRRTDAAKPSTVIVWPGSPFPLPMKYYGGLQLAIALIMAAAALVLVVACANVGSLQLARARSRQNELRTRLSLGASRYRLIRQLVTETALVGLLAGVLALLFSMAFCRGLVILFANSLPVELGTIVFKVTPDLEVFAYVVAVSLIAGMLAGLAPALESSRSALSSAVRSSTSTVGNRRLQDILVAAQVALSLVLMIAGSMALRSAMRSLEMDPGYETKHAIHLNVQFPQGSTYTPQLKLALTNELRNRISALPGVAAITSARAPGDNGFRTVAAGQNAQSILQYAYVQPNYFETLSIPLLVGRSFQTQDSVMVSESAAKQLWPGQNPVGQTLRLGAIDERVHNLRELTLTGPSYQVVGIVRDTRGADFDGSDSKRVYLPIPDDRLPNYSLLIRTKSDPATVIKTIDAVVSSIDSRLLTSSATLQDMLRQTGPFIALSLAAAVASAVGLLGLLLATMGIYGTVSYIVVLRTREVGIRMAIGAQKRDVGSLILRESARPVMAGLIAGILLATGASYLARGLLFGIKGVDGISFSGVSCLFLLIALFASYPPARRAMRVDPMVALRYE